MADHLARFRPNQREGVGAAIAFAIADAHRIRRLADQAPTVNERRAGHAEAAAIDALAARMKALL